MNNEREREREKKRWVASDEWHPKFTSDLHTRVYMCALLCLWNRDVPTATYLPEMPPTPHVTNKSSLFLRDVLDHLPKSWSSHTLWVRFGTHSDRKEPTHKWEPWSRVFHRLAALEWNHHAWCGVTVDSLLEPQGCSVGQHTHRRMIALEGQLTHLWSIRDWHLSCQHWIWGIFIAFPYYFSTHFLLF